jgi:hypothetical protein
MDKHSLQRKSGSHFVFLLIDLLFLGSVAFQKLFHIDKDNYRNKVDP